MKGHLARVFLMGGLLVLSVAGLVFSDAPSQVDWTGLRAVVLESDDWGLPGFVPAAGAWEGLDPSDLAPGRFPPVYWESTLEDSTMVADLCAVLASVRGRDGQPAVFQPNYVMGSLEPLSESPEAQWRRLYYPELPTAYQRPGLQSAVANGQAAGVWYPEFHASLHYDPALRLSAALDGDTATRATRRGIMLFPGSEAARELGPWRDAQDLGQELDLSMAAFVRAFGRPVGSIIAPDYTWTARNEAIWESRGLTVIQAKREQRNPELGAGLTGRLAKVWFRALDRRRHAARCYLERNCRLEPVQAPDPDQAVARCVADARQAWERGQPAIVETHRINFAHTDPAVVRTGQAALAAFLAAITRDGDPLPVFLTDTEVAQLARRGISVSRRGAHLILRNGTRSAKVVSPVLGTPTEPTASAGAPTFLLLGPGQTLIL